MNLSNTNANKFFAGSNGGVEQVAPSALKVINSKATFILKGLQALGNYTIMLSAQTIEGDGPLSLPIFCLTKPSGRNFYFKNYFMKIREIKLNSKCSRILYLLERKKNTYYFAKKKV